MTGCATSQAMSPALALSREQLVGQIEALERERCAMEATALMLDNHQKRLQRMLVDEQQQLEQAQRQQQLEQAQRQQQLEQAQRQQQLMLQNRRTAAQAQAQVQQQQQQPRQQQMVLSIAQADLAIIAPHVPTLEVLSGASLAVDAGGVQALNSACEQQLWLVISGTPQQLTTASKLISSLLNGGSILA